MPGLLLCSTAAYEHRYHGSDIYHYIVRDHTNNTIATQIASLFGHN